MLVGLISVLFSCGNPVSLGTRLDIDGPVVEFTAPVPRKAVQSEFSLEGTISDYSGVKLMVVKATLTTVNGVKEFPKQWRYNRGSWEISEDSGASWQALEGAEWNGTIKDASWKIPIDLALNGMDPEDGEYVFSVEAWDTSNMSDDNSYKTLVLIFDVDPPRVEITNPNLYGKYVNNGVFSDPELQALHDIDDDSDEWKQSAMIGKLLTQEFLMQWQIEDQHDIWSIDIRFYKHDVYIDDDPETPLPEDDSYIYYYHENLPPPPVAPDPNSNIKPNGSVQVPDLAGERGIYSGGGDLKNPVTEKTTIRVVAVSYDAAGHPSQEKTLGYFVFWPKADFPWITYAEGMEEDYPPDTDLYMVYPGRSIKATAFHYVGVSYVEYSVYDYGNKTLGIIPSDNLRDSGRIDNPPRFNGILSTIFPWEFTPPSSSGYFKVFAEAFDAKGKPSGKYAVLFEVQDITFPDFPVPPNPPASEPLYMHIDESNDSITISGIVTDATEIRSLCLVWINPQSRNYAAMSQLSYFRDKDYVGWQIALTLDPGGTGTEGNFDPNYPNRLWKLVLEPQGEDPETGRQVYSYSQSISLGDTLNIGINKEALTSQVFLLRAENPDNKCTIITYAPQGDELAPEIRISNVLITGLGKNINCEPGKYVLIQQFAVGDTITVNGTWREDSTEYLPVETYFYPNFDVTVNGHSLPVTSFSPATGKTRSGDWTVVVNIGGPDSAFPTTYLKDTLVVSASVRDVGRIKAEANGSWLIESENLRLMRISSEMPDQTYKAGDPIEFFLEFSKPVQLTNGGTPVLNLNSTGTGVTAVATYRGGQINQNTRQYFQYTVQPGHTTGTSYLNVTGPDISIQWTAANYPYTWHRGTGGEREEIRVTSESAHDGANILPETNSYARKLPVTEISTDPDYQFTLIAGKHLTIDTSPPRVTSITANTLQGYYTKGSEIYMTVRFDKPVTIGATIPRLQLQVTNGANTTVSTDPSSVRVNGNDITFVYTVQAGDYTPSTNPIVVTDLTGDVTDLAGTPLDDGGIRDFTNRTLTGVYIDTIDPVAPTVRVYANSTGTTVLGTSGAATVNLSNLYHGALRLAIQPEDQYADLEYSINGGTSWIKAPNKTNTPFSISQQGAYNIIARQTDRAGNPSNDTSPVNFTWDPGNLITRISSTTPNGTYTNTTSSGGTRVDRISITVHFRKPVTFTGSPTITLNVRDGTSPVTVSASAGTVEELTFTYTIGASDNSPSATTALTVTAFSGYTTARDADSVDVSSYVNLPATDALLQGKTIYVQTGALTNTAPTYNNGLVTGGGVQTDGSYNTALVVNFNRNIIKGTGTITITQSETGYRLPAVLTEAQRSKFMSIANFGTLYTRGTNGYTRGDTVDDDTADTSTKYILHNDVDTASLTAAAGLTATGLTLAQMNTFATAFRTQERVVLSINSPSVVISGTELRIMLTGSNALQVPGATYLVTYNSGFVQDSLSTPCSAASDVTVSIGGVAKPFIRIKKSQDTITTGAGNQPSLVVTLPLTAQVRMDCRTPESTIRYNPTEATTNVTAATSANYGNWSSANGPNDSLTTGNAGRPTLPANNNAGTEYIGPFTIAPATDSDTNPQGYQWRANARAFVGTTSSPNVNSEEMAFRTVITYRSNNMNATGGQNLSIGDHIWIRGGDAIGSSSVPGFPLTWDIQEFENCQTNRSRAGIRLMSLTNPSGNYNNTSTWKWVTWEINVTTYIDMILGRGAVPIDEALQYGPRQWAYQRAGWTSYKEQYRVFPGKHRWLEVVNAAVDGKGQVNFTDMFVPRGTYTVNYQP
jgi:hypothetical protein